MTAVLDTLWQALAWSKNEPLLAVALLLLLLGPGAICGSLGYCITGIRIVSGAHRVTRRVRSGRTDRIEERLAHLCNALAILTDSTESGLREALTGLERLSGAVPAPAQTSTLPRPGVGTAGATGQTARDIAIAEGVSEGEVRLRMRLHKEMTCQAASTAH